MSLTWITLPMLFYQTLWHISSRSLCLKPTAYTVCEGTRYKTYQAINPELSVHLLYTNTSSTLFYYLRVTFTRFRLSSHRLRVEMGRWSRTPPEQRLCQCETGIQNEQHILVCPLTQDIRLKYGYELTDLSSLFEGTNRETLHMLHACLSLLEQQKAHGVWVKGFCVVDCIF